MKLLPVLCNKVCGVSRDRRATVPRTQRERGCPGDPRQQPSVTGKRHGLARMRHSGTTSPPVGCQLWISRTQQSCSTPALQLCRWVRVPTSQIVAALVDAGGMGWPSARPSASISLMISPTLSGTAAAFQPAPTVERLEGAPGPGGAKSGDGGPHVTDLPHQHAAVSNAPTLRPTRCRGYLRAAR